MLAEFEVDGFKMLEGCLWVVSGGILYFMLNVKRFKDSV